jgi:heme O synthase-like polyprenyltransferase
MLPISDPDGHCTASTILLWAILLIPATLAPALVLRSPLGSTLGWTTVAVALGTGTVYVWLAARLWRSRSLKDARRVFFASIMHLPLLLMVMVGDALIRSWLR